MLASAHIALVSDTLQDKTNVTFTVADHIAFLNDAIRALVSVRPDAANVVASILLQAGTRQALSGISDLRLITVDRNMGANGATIGRAINIADKKSKDTLTPDWHTATASAVVREYMFDEATPKVFWVSPPVPASPAVYVEVSKSVLPATVAAAGDTIPVDDIHAPALREWCTYLAFSRDSMQTPNWQRAARHFASFFNLLQVKMQADMAINPKVRAMAEKQ